MLVWLGRLISRRDQEAQAYIFDRKFTPRRKRI